MEFRGFPKMGRLRRTCSITEKIDGTNAQIVITEDGQLMAGSRARFITPDDDNHGFARWAHEHRDELVAGLGIGTHFGEWWGQGIQRKYGLAEKRFSLFNTLRWHPKGKEPRLASSEWGPEKWTTEAPACCGVVPLLYRGIFNDTAVDGELERLAASGSVAAPGFLQPEGIVVYHEAAGVSFKVTLDGDGYKDRRRSPSAV